MITRKVVEVAEKLGVAASQVAINWTRQHKGQSVIPIVGATKPSQVEDVLGCLQFELPADAMHELNEVSKFELPFPQKFFSEQTVIDILYGGIKDKMKDSRY
jgi:aryl-alcohol dehydrogenase-like predicted oxidoreductase